MTQQVDLNQLRSRVLSNQQSGTDLPNSTDRNVFVLAGDKAPLV